MRGVVFHGERELELMQFPDPTPDPHDVVIEMKASGMCGSDLHQYRRPKMGWKTSPCRINRTGSSPISPQRYPVHGTASLARTSSTAAPFLGRRAFFCS